MRKNVKKIAATVMAAMTVITAMSTTSMAASNKYIGNTYYTFNWGTKKVYVGDCNEDGVINIADLVALRSVSNKGRYILNAWAVYDCNQDGYVNEKDVTALQDYLLGR